MPDRSRQAPPRSGERPERVGHYEILDELARGGMGVVYRARDVNLGREVALKRPHLGREGDSEYRRRFLREARAAAAVAHPNIVPIYEAFEHDGVPWMAMELVEGRSLRTLLHEGRSFSLDDILRHAESLAGALQAAHGRHVLHRDVNPNNILITPDGRALVTDFGLARILAAPDESSGPTQSHGSTATGRVMGTAGYMAPEQAQGQAVDPRTDIYSLGAVLYEICTGKQAAYGSTPGAVAEAISTRESEGGSRLDPALSREVERVVCKAMASHPEERYQSAGELLEDLKEVHRKREYESYLEEHPPEPGPRRGLRGGHMAALAALPVLVALVVFIVWWLSPTVPFDERDWLLITDFENATGEEVFDQTLRC